MLHDIAESNGLRSDVRKFADFNIAANKSTGTKSTSNIRKTSGSFTANAKTRERIAVSTSRKRTENCQRELFICLLAKVAMATGTEELNQSVQSCVRSSA